MKKVKQLFLVVPVFLLSACFSLPEIGDFSLDDKIGESVSSAMGLDNLAAEMQALQFYSLYLSYAFYGGYSYETGFAEGQGLRWQFTTDPAEGERQISEFERVYLKDMKDGTTWWRLSAENKEEAAEYEYLMDEDSNILVIRYKDSDTNEVIEYRPPTSEEEPDEAEDMGEESDAELTIEEYESYDEYEYNQYSAGKEKITVPAGTYTAEHMVSEIQDDSDPENPVDLRTDWWIVESVPGGVIKYLWLDNADNSSITSELMDVLENQKTRLDSY